MYHLHTSAGVFWIEPSKSPPERWLLCFTPAGGTGTKSWPFRTMNAAAAAVSSRRTGFAEWDGLAIKLDVPRDLQGWTRGMPPPRSG